MNQLIESSDEFMTEKVVYFIEKYETMNIIVKNSNKSVNIQLVNVALISEFFTNLMYLKKFFNKRNLLKYREKEITLQKKRSFVMSNQSKIIEFSKKKFRLIKFSKYLMLNLKNQDLI